MARSQIVKFRLSASEFEGLVGRLKGTDTVSSYCRRALGIDGVRLTQANGKAMPNLPTVARGGQTAMSVKPCPVAKYCIWRKDGGCTSPKYTPVCPLGAEAWELL